MPRQGRCSLSDGGACVYSEVASSDQRCEPTLDHRVLAGRSGSTRKVHLNALDAARGAHKEKPRLAAGLRLNQGQNPGSPRCWPWFAASSLTRQCAEHSRLASRYFTTPFYVAPPRSRVLRYEVPKRRSVVACRLKAGLPVTSGTTPPIARHRFPAAASPLGLASLGGPVALWLKGYRIPVRSCPPFPRERRSGVRRIQVRAPKSTPVRRVRKRFGTRFP